MIGLHYKYKNRGLHLYKKSLKIPNPYIEEEQTTQWPKEKVQKDKQWSTKHTYKTKDRVTRVPLRTEGELRCSGRVSSSRVSRSQIVLYKRQWCSPSIWLTLHLIGNR